MGHGCIVQHVAVAVVLGGITLMTPSAPIDILRLPWKARLARRWAAAPMLPPVLAGLVVVALRRRHSSRTACNATTETTSHSFRDSVATCLYESVSVCFCLCDSGSTRSRRIFWGRRAHRSQLIWFIHEQRAPLMGCSESAASEWEYFQMSDWAK